MNVYRLGTTVDFRKFHIRYHIVPMFSGTISQPRLVPGAFMYNVVTDLFPPNDIYISTSKSPDIFVKTSSTVGKNNFVFTAFPSRTFLYCKIVYFILPPETRRAPL